MIRRLSLTALIALSLAVTGACSKKEGSENDAPAAKPSHTYQGRGIVRGVRLDKDKTTLSIQHEAIPDWVNRQGQAVGMMSMTMEFEAAPSLDVGAVKTGDKIAFGIAVYYGDGSRLEITSLEKLPPETALEIAGDH